MWEISDNGRRHTNNDGYEGKRYGPLTRQYRHPGCKGKRLIPGEYNGKRETEIGVKPHKSVVEADLVHAEILAAREKSKDTLINCKGNSRAFRRARARRRRAKARRTGVAQW